MKSIFKSCRLVRERFRRAAPLLFFTLLFTGARAATLVDNFADRQVITDKKGAIDGSNVGATVELNEPRHSGNVGGHSVWISWVAPEDGIATFQTDGSNFDTTLAVYFFGSPTDTTLDRLHEEAESDDAPGIAPASLIQFGAKAGVRYEIAVDGYNGAVGDIHLSWDFIAVTDPPPIIVSIPNDLAARQGDPVTLTVDIQGSKRMKLNWRLNENDLGVEGPTVFIPSLQPENLGLYTVRITLDNVRFETRPIELQINSEGQTNALARDKLFESFDSRIHSEGEIAGAAAAPIRAASLQAAAAIAPAGGVVRGYNGTQIFDTTFATSDPGEPLHCGISRNATYWLSYEAPTNGAVTLDTIGSSYDTVLAVYSYQPPLTTYAQLTPINCDHGSAGAGASRVVFNVIKGGQYAFVVAAAGTTHGIAHLNYSLSTEAPPPPPTPPTIAAIPSVLVAAVGSDILLQANITGTEPIVCKWQKDGLTLDGQTARSLLLRNTTRLDSGDYTLIATNAAPVPLIVTFPVNVVVPPQLQTVLTNDGILISFATEPGQQYTVESGDTIGAWNPIRYSITGNGDVVTFTNSATAGAGFFRFRVQ